MGSSGGLQSLVDAADATEVVASDGAPSDATTVNAVADASDVGDAPLDVGVLLDSGGDASDGMISGMITGSCDYVVDTAPVVMVTYAPGSMPVYTKGGTIADGTYWLTGVVVYVSGEATDATGPSYQETVEVFGTSWNNVDIYGGMTRRATETLTVQGASGTLVYTCDSLNDPILLQETVSFTFEVDGNTLLIADETDRYTLTYVRQSL